eukprot:3484302-Alexandrium_andersonii.AAC.1
MAAHGDKDGGLGAIAGPAGLGVGAIAGPAGLGVGAIAGPAGVGAAPAAHRCAANGAPRGTLSIGTAGGGGAPGHRIGLKRAQRGERTAGAVLNLWPAGGVRNHPQEFAAVWERGTKQHQTRR